MGRPPKPVELKRKLGNPGQRSLSPLSEVAHVDAVDPDPPAHLSAAGRSFWARAVESATWIAATDAPVLLLLAEQLDRRADWLGRIAADSPVLVSPRGQQYAHPLVRPVAVLEAEILKSFSALGFTPADRTRMGVAEIKATNAFEEMLARRQCRE
ncbi:P27 family phage terminase small subunit [Kitasatospora sp. NBC_01266]|uniref:P27 family phage terminase small subunit n=1 Tax=Kitasatospora sp. NBC_01266 TaxID=2903572 RepID=UPI002E37969C|nr:P27 family phage terminase small subunit [Kitasatospora sp. NBC_01266]